MSIKQKNKYGNNNLHYTDNSTNVNYFNYNAKSDKSDSITFGSVILVAVLGIATHLPNIFDYFKQYSDFQVQLIIGLYLLSGIIIWFRSKQLKNLFITVAQAIFPLIIQHNFQKIQLPQTVLQYCDFLKNNFSQSGTQAILESIKPNINIILYIFALTFVFVLFIVSVFMNFYRTSVKKVVFDLMSLLIPFIFAMLFLFFGSNILSIPVN